MFKLRGSPRQNRTTHLSAPTGGLDATSPLMDMPPGRLVIGDNWFCTPGGLITREGYISHVTGFANPVKRLHNYAATSGSESLWATTNAGIYNATSAGAVGATVMALTEGKTIATTIATGAGNYLMVVNGVDTLKQYDGTSWSSVATFGATSTVVYSYVETYRQRLFLAKRASLEIEYLAANSIAGAATNYPLGALFRQGGYIVALGTWTLDGGTGPEDHLAVITNKGEVAVFAGNDPATWNLKGVYFIGRPLGAKCMYKYGGDLLVLTEQGLYPLSSAVQSTAIERNKAVSQDIKTTLANAARAYFDRDGWEVIADPAAPSLLINIPSNPNKKQAVMHAQSGAWTTFSGMEANCFARKEQRLYFATDTAVYAITGTSDLGANITATMFQAYNRLGSERTKKVEMLRAALSANGGFTYSLGIINDYTDPREYTFHVPQGNFTSSVWGTAVFGTDVWGGDSGIPVPVQDWQTVPDDYSRLKGLAVRVISNNARVNYFGSDIIFGLGGNF